MGVQWWLVGWRSTSRHFVNSISLSFPLPAHELNSHIDRDPSLRVCFLSRLSIRNFLERASKRSLCKLYKMDWKKDKRELVNNRRDDVFSPLFAMFFMSLCCRDCWLAATKCPQSICSWQTNCTTWSTTPVIRWFNADVITTSSSYGCNGEPR